MAKQKDEDLTGAHNVQVLRAIKTIGQGLMDLADALAQGAEVKPDPRSAGRRSPEPSPPAEEPEEEDGDATEEIKLADLQKMAKDLIKGGGRDKLVTILEDLDLDTVSSAPEEKWAELKEHLEAASE